MSAVGTDPGLSVPLARAAGSPPGPAVPPGRLRRSLPGGPRVLMVDPDPYLAFLVRRVLPNAAIATGEDADRLGALAGRVDLAVVDLDSPGAARFLARQPGLKVLGVADASRAASSICPAGVEGLVLRPFAPAELTGALRQAAGLDQPRRVRRKGMVEQTRAWLLTVRVATVILASVLELAAHGLSWSGSGLVLAVAAYLGISLAVRRRSQYWALLDVAVATVGIAFTGGLTSPYTPFGVVAVAAAGLVVGSPVSALCGLIPMAGPALVLARGEHAGSPSAMVAWFGLFPLASLIGSVLGRTAARATRPETRLTAEANRMLSALFRIARTMPGGFDLSTVAAAALEEVTTSLPAAAGMLVVRDAGLARVAGARGVGVAEGLTLADADLPPELLRATPTLLAAAAVPAPLSALMAPHPCWIAAPLGAEGRDVGALLVACGDCSAHSHSLEVLQTIALQAGMAVENARLFARVRELSAQEERRRLGGELHDGLAQALVHIRMELELLSRPGEAGDPPVRAEVARLARVAAEALTDVRSTINGLRSPLGEGLVGAARSYLHDLSSLGGPAVQFVATGDCRLPAPLEVEVFRVCQEAVSNALRHAQGSRILVGLDGTQDGVRLVVEDDGVGLAATAAAKGSGGHGLQTMHERARRAGGWLAITPCPSGGTRVELFVGTAVVPVGGRMEARSA